MTDGSGEFQFDEVAEGVVTLEAERPGFFKSTQADSGRPETSSGFHVDHNMSGVVLKLVPWADITVHVRSVTGVPIQGFPVRLYERKIADGMAQWEKEVSLATSVDGFCRVFSLAEGSFVLAAGPEFWRPRPPAAKHIGYPQVFYPGVHELSAATVITITAGQKVEVDFALSQEPLFEISGIVADVPESVDTKIELSSDAGDPVPVVQLHPARHEFFGYATAGRYTLRASADVNGKSMAATVPLTLAANTAGIHVVLAPQISIPVTVKSDFAEIGGGRGALALGASVKLKSKAGLTSVEMMATQLEPRNRNSMQVSGVEPGRYSVEISSFSSYVKSATSGSTDLLQNDFVVPEDGNVEPIEILLANDGGEISGNVKLPDPNSSVTVLLVPERGSIKLLKTTVAESGGAFTFEQVAPGDYLLFAFDRTKYLEYRNPDLLRSYRSGATHIYVSSHQHVTTNLEVISLEK